MKKIAAIEKNDRPREKLKLKGARALSDFELLQALIGSGNKQADVSQIAKKAQKLLQKYGTDITYEQLAEVTGLGAAKVAELLAAFELSRRHLIKDEQPIIDSPEKAIDQVQDIRGKRQEYLICLTLDGASRLIAKRIISIGILNKSLAHPREIFADAITDRAAHLILLHNHPSGTLTPSDADLEVTQRVKEAGNIIGIELLDHIIVTKDDYISIQLQQNTPPSEVEYAHMLGNDAIFSE